MVIAATALAAVASPTQVDSLQQMFFRTSNLAGNLQQHMAGGSMGAHSCESKFPILSEQGKCDTLMIGAAASHRMTVDFSSATTWKYEIEEGNSFHNYARSFPQKREHHGCYDTATLHAKMAEPSKKQLSLQAKLEALERARSLALEVDTQPPLSQKEFQERELEVTGMGANIGTARVWDTGATAGMTKPGSTAGLIKTGRSARVSTGAGVVRTNAWVEEFLPWGSVDHVGLDETQNTLSAGQHNAELGVETSWLAPENPGLNSICGDCILHSSDGGHVIWSGSHRVQKTAIRCRTPEIQDDDEILTISGEFCATTGCSCNLPKLAEAIRNAEGIDYDRALAAGNAEVSDDWIQPSRTSASSSGPSPRSPHVALEAGQVQEAGDVAPEVSVQHEPNANSDAPSAEGGSAIPPERAEGQGHHLDSCDVDKAALALHGAGGARCGCSLCQQVKQRRHAAKAGSHPHSED